MKIQPTTWALGAGMALLGLLACRIWRSAPDEPGLRPAGSPTSPLPGAAASTARTGALSKLQASTGAAGACVLSSNDLMVFVDCSDPYELVVRTYERIPGTDEWESESPQVHSTSYRIGDVTARQSNELYVVGASSAGEFVLERWTLNEPPGSRYFHVAETNQPFGVSLPPIPGVSQGIHGEDYAAASSRPPVRRVRRLELARQPIPGTPQWLVADPEGRYVVFGTAEPAIVYQWRPGSGGLLTPLVDEAGLPWLKRVRGVALAQHTTLGRLLILLASEDSPNLGDRRLVFSDAQNTGSFAPPEVYSQAQWDELGFEAAVWLRPTFQDWTTD